MPNVHDACNIIVFDNESQINSCANSMNYKFYNGFSSLVIGIIISIILCIILLKNNTSKFLCFIIVISILSAAFAYGYYSADKASVKAEYDRDQIELDSRQSKFTDRASNISNLISERGLKKELDRQIQANNRYNGYNNSYYGQPGYGYYGQPGYGYNNSGTTISFN